MKNLTKLIENLTEHYDWALANEWETPITLSDDIEKAIEILKLYEKMMKEVDKICQNTSE